MPKLKDDEILYRAREIMKARMVRESGAITRPSTSKAYLEVLLGHYEHEVFAILTLDNKNRVIKFHEVFRGTIDGSSVYPREVAKIAFMDNAAAVIIAHNHPSGIPEPSQADIRITETLKKALNLLDIQLLDHIIIGAPDNHVALSERGLV